MFKQQVLIDVLPTDLKEFHREGHKETQELFRFTNGYGASVISDGYGEKQGFLELAVLRQGRICYDTPITEDVEGWLTADRVIELLYQIQKL